MIFVTVGTHEQPFNRLVSYMDRWASEHDEKVIMQTGFSTYEPEHCEYKNMFTYEKMQEILPEARVLISHGGPSSFMPFLISGKKAIVVPRQKEFEEHVNDHQLLFCDAFSEKYGGITVVKDIETLGDVIKLFDDPEYCETNKFVSTNAEFCEGFKSIVDGLCK